MADEPPKLDSELESFRQQWQTELKHKREVPEAREPRSKREASSSSKQSVAAEIPKSVVAKRSQVEEDEEYAQSLVFDEPAPIVSGSNLEGQSGPSTKEAKELVSALDHFEEAVEKEAIGSLGDSLKLYRKAFRMDNRVDLAYRKKHFPTGVAKAPQPSASGPTAAAASSTSKPAETQTMSELIAGFSGLCVSAAPPPVEGDPVPPCPIAGMPEEILVHIFKDVAVLDVGDFVRLSLVCKRFAYIAATEQQIWRRIALGTEFGFAGMHYHWQRGVSWEPLDEEQEQDNGDLGYVTMQELAQRRKEESENTALTLLPELYASSWQNMFRHRPRIRFNGCYISTVNYIRSGQANANQITWNSPVHIVTYYRYLRFFRDGTAISLLTTDEPAHVVHYMTKDLLEHHRGGGGAHLPSVVLQHGFRGRWRLSSNLDHPDRPLGEVEGDLAVETEGVGAKYTYRMYLEMRNAGKGARNTKLVWKGFYSYNKLTDDLGEFALKNDKPFFFSRVKSYGVGE
ncbi:F-box domain-containing protein [Colletotrichum orchidophilum]|uniref:F-box domain-containing protein n=1 Tax=Colletotrichum orchidophilum TaxID=1209926 RepID=A0A1G4AUD3_9PEZI|nr:F-box domain-containing protein [Colletotrichum orchidophilum]OHE92711.1 F-box domain-containing protein [Colletotrichum orchidophilum]